MNGQLVMKNSHQCDSKGPFITANVAGEDDILPSGGDITSSDSETEQIDVSSDENIVSESDSYDN